MIHIISILFVLNVHRIQFRYSQERIAINEEKEYKNTWIYRTISTNIYIHTHIYIYIYIYAREKRSGDDNGSTSWSTRSARDYNACIILHTTFFSSTRHVLEDDVLQKDRALKIYLYFYYVREMVERQTLNGKLLSFLFTKNEVDWFLGKIYSYSYYICYHCTLYFYRSCSYWP